jgi:hypothetical protein
MKKGDKISWQYTHHLNSRSATEIVKTGVFIKELKNGKALVRFKGNKTDSRVPQSELVVDEKKETSTKY